ncbi:DEAD/DEAH box helicase [Subsaximicrobium wynnwilliamsii]|uniref:RNA helicase n=1 Tax=Subsaximicrobium wynnwilliamsii TaxID=291179 RepID=A0A5C6ZI38_9FLAO|nr:DEAD/DEAH box helicase [Subsaximicrobium wynnwilliamsii]TXD84046.1 DEAD/DEAH box helicase [Subsaximicrobium wynnwilliamsii]TXD88996.1 DEAD/DEAH box helicase [Subsaximicrobium wynnwilliamsii]TXE03758.1 DEAD/DEAH box helicase [Subsaximicrobium wynnwilliamsii]
MANTFSDLGIKNQFIKGLKELSIKTPTDIQEQAIPTLLKNNTDFIGLAQTGTGKTAAYGLPILQNIDPKNDEIQALILAPTRELVQQIQKQLFKFTKYCEHQIFAEGIYGGEKMDIQLKRIQRTTHIVVATPGRLLDFIERGEIDIKNIRTLVLDEADEMLSMGFKQDLNKILNYTTGTRYTWLFSATFPEDIQSMVKTYMHKDAVTVEIDKNSLVNANISHHYIVTSIKEKTNVIARLLDKYDDDRGIIFTRTKAGAMQLTENLKAEGFAVEALQGDMQQKERDKVMRAFKNQSLQYLISTDVSARGIDVNNLAFVIHHQLPDQQEYYTHRSGRTARAGKTGESIALIISGEEQEIQKLQKDLDIKFKQLTF